MSGPLPRPLPSPHLFAGYVKIGADGRYQLEPGKLEPVTNVILLTCGVGENQLVLWKTDDKGMFYALGRTSQERDTAVHFQGTRQFQFLPPDVILSMWAVHREEWAEKLKEALKSQDSAGGRAGVALTTYEIKKSYLKEPDRKSDEDADKIYRDWYDQRGNEKLYGFIIPKVRALALTLPEALRHASVKITTPSNEVLDALVEVQGAQTIAVVTGSSDSLRPGVHSFTVKMRDAPEPGWSKGLRETRSYTFKEMVRFGITNFAGEFDVVSGDPFSVEEAVMTQFPTLYAHRALKAKQETMHPDLTADFGKDKSVTPALKQWTERVGWAHARAKFTVEMINADGVWKHGNLLGKAIVGAFNSDDRLSKSIRDGIGLAFSVHDYAHDWSKFLKGLKTEKGLEALGVKPLLWEELDSVWKRYRWWKYVKKEWVEGEGLGAAKIYNLGRLNERHLKAALKAGVPNDYDKLQKLVGEVPGKRIAATITAGATALGVLNAAVAINQLCTTVKEHGKVQRDFESLISQFHSELGGAPCREAIGNLERMRAATVASGMKLEDDEVEALMATFDVVCGVLSLVGIGEMAIGALALVRSTGALLVAAAQWLDRAGLSGAIHDLLGEHKQMYDLARASEVNQGQMAPAESVPANDPKTDLQVQFRLRAEALNGLVGLLVRAGIESNSPEAYHQKIKEYQVPEYIATYLLEDGWQFPRHRVLPIGMDAVWLMRKRPLALASKQSISQQAGYGNLLKVGATASIPGGMFMMIGADHLSIGHVKADFQTSFPIHRVESESIDQLADAFRTSWHELSRDSVEYTRIYWRKRKPRLDGSDSPWKPIDEFGNGLEEEIPILSPLDQIRIIVVLKETVKGGPYPISVQLHRVDGLPIEGPIYRGITRVLGDDDLIPGEEAFKKTKDKQYLGCVFYPFYQFGNQVIPGIKPMARLSTLLGADLVKWIGWLDDMRYSFQLHLGNATSGPWVKLGPGQASKLDEVRVGFHSDTDQRNPDENEQENKLLVSEFLASTSEKFEFPRMWNVATSSPPSVRIGGRGAYQLASWKEIKVDYNWTDKVEVVFVVWIPRPLDIMGFVKEDLDWSRIPVEMQLDECSGIWSNSEGPIYPAKLEYIGFLPNTDLGAGPGLPSPGFQLLPSDPIMKVLGGPPIDPREPSPQVAEWLAGLRSNPEMSRVLAQMYHSATGSHVYAAHVSLDYYLPTVPGAPPDPRGGYREALRPFGKVLQSTPAEANYYKIGIKNIQTPASVGAIRPYGEGHVLFKAPVAGYPAFATLDPAAYERWVEEDAKRRDPTLELVAKHEAVGQQKAVAKH